MDILALLLPIFTEYGYIAVFFMLLVSGLGIPLPEDITLVAGGIIAGLGYANEKIMVINCLAGVLIGDGFMFMMGFLFGKKVRRFRLIGKILTEKRLEIVQEKFMTYGNFILFFARFLPGLRATIFVFAGLSHRVSFLKFLSIDGFAALISVPVWIYLGVYGAQNIEQLMHWVEHAQLGIRIAVIAIAILAVGFLWYRHKTQHKDV